MQWEAHQLIDLVRFAVNVWHRRGGKTVGAVNDSIKGGLSVPLPNPHCAYIAPFRKQAKKVAWEYLNIFGGKLPGAKFNKSELTLTVPRNRNDAITLQLLGADQPDNELGQYFDFVVMDEYAKMHPRMWSQVVRPALSDRRGRAIFIGTPRGRNSFYDLYMSAGETPEWGRTMLKASESGLIAPDELASARATMSEAEYEQEYECSWTAAIRGSFYGKEMAEAHEEGRITTVPMEQGLPVFTSWDLGIRDSVVWFWQVAGTQVRAIACKWYQSKSLTEIAKDVQSTGYMFGGHILPHDGKQRDYETGKTRKQTLQRLGFTVIDCPNISELEGIEQFRMMIPRILFDEKRCKEGIEALIQFRTEYDEQKRSYRTTPLEDWTNHFADAARYFAVKNGGKNISYQWQQPIPYNKRSA